MTQNGNAKYVADNTKSSKDDKENSTNPELNFSQEIIIDFAVAEVPGGEKVLVLSKWYNLIIFVNIIYDTIW